MVSVRLFVSAALVALPLGLGLTLSHRALAQDAEENGESVDLISVGLGYFDQSFLDPEFIWFDNPDHGPFEEAVDFRLEYRFGESLLPFTEPYALFKPWVGAEATSDGALYGAGGILIDIPVGSFVFTPSLGVGLFSEGGGKELGSVIEFRSQLEVGYEFENNSRFGVTYSHISNAGISETNPGANLIVVYYHVPVDWFLGGND